jgi:hypothetical protein
VACYSRLPHETPPDHRGRLSHWQTGRIATPGGRPNSAETTDLVLGKGEVVSSILPGSTITPGARALGAPTVWCGALRRFNEDEAKSGQYHGRSLRRGELYRANAMETKAGSPPGRMHP